MKRHKFHGEKMSRMPIVEKENLNGKGKSKWVGTNRRRETGSWKVQEETQDPKLPVEEIRF
jgi:hypothetical protein